MCTGEVVPLRRYIINITDSTVMVKAITQPIRSSIRGTMLIPLSARKDALENGGKVRWKFELE